MNGLITNNCCCEQGDCCQVSGPEPYWYNRYRFNLIGSFVHELVEGECQYAVNPCGRCPEPADCGEDCVPCLQRTYEQATASGVIYRHPIFHPGPPGPANCDTTATNPDIEWWLGNPNICTSAPYTPPNYDHTVGGITSNYLSAPCDCELAGNDRVLWTGQRGHEDVSGCYTGCPGYEFYDEQISCFGNAHLRCNETSCQFPDGNGIPQYPCCSSSPDDTRYHHFTVTTGAWNDVGATCDCGAFSTKLVFAARLGPTLGPHLATWELVFAGTADSPCNDLPACGVDPCCDDCAGFECGLCPQGQGSCNLCRTLTRGYPTIEFIPEP